MRMKKYLTAQLPNILYCITVLNAAWSLTWIPVDFADALKNVASMRALSKVVQSSGKKAPKLALWCYLKEGDGVLERVNSKSI